MDDATADGEVVADGVLVREGDEVTVSVEGVGELTNPCAFE